MTKKQSTLLNQTGSIAPNGDNGTTRTLQDHRVEANIGMEVDERAAVVDLLNCRLSDNVTLYLKTRKYHWNVRGIHFGQLHELFEEQYTLLEAAQDEVAERVRQLGGIAYGTMEEFRNNTALQEQPGVNPPAEQMIRDLLNDHEMVIRQLRDDIDSTAEKFNDQPTSDFLTAIVLQHEKIAWMLRAHLEAE